MFTLAYIGVGANLGDRKHSIHAARKTLENNSRIRFIRAAPVYETDPVGGPPQEKYLNTVWEIETDLSAEDLMDFDARKNEPSSDFSDFVKQLKRKGVLLFFHHPLHTLKETSEGFRVKAGDKTFLAKKVVKRSKKGWGG